MNQDTPPLSAKTAGTRRLFLPLLLAVLLVSFCKWELYAAPTNDSTANSTFLLDISELAKLERVRAGIPASITAAQAILESNWGRAPIAVSGNNYFGIKCKSWWTGTEVYHEDDDYNAQGQLVKSCFRAYEEIAESFRDHSEFLITSERYRGLFSLPITDYRGWARGLRQCGYATDPAYAEKLISLIERLDLHLLDLPEPALEPWQMAFSDEPTSAEVWSAEDYADR